MLSFLSGAIIAALIMTFVTVAQHKAWEKDYKKLIVEKSLVKLDLDDEIKKNKDVKEEIIAMMARVKGGEII